MAANEHGEGVESNKGRNSSAQNPEEIAIDVTQLLTPHCLHGIQGRYLESPWTKLEQPTCIRLWAEPFRLVQPSRR